MTDSEIQNHCGVIVSYGIGGRVGLSWMASERTKAFVPQAARRLASILMSAADKADDEWRKTEPLKDS